MISDATYPHSEPLRADMAIRPTMPRLFKGEDHLQPCTSTMPDRLDQVCVVSQKGINEELSYTADTRHIITGAGCKTLANNPLGFCKFASLPTTTIYLTSMNDGDGMQATFQRNRTKWHDSC